MVLTCHSPGYDEKRLASMLKEASSARFGVVEAFPVQITAESGNSLPCGAAVRTTTRR
jgi:hypothetical protein